MERFPVQVLLMITEFLSEFGTIREDFNQSLSTREKEVLARSVAQWQMRFARMGLRASAKTCEKIVNLMATLEPSKPEFRILAEELKGRLEDELQGTVFLYLPTNEANYYEKPLAGLNDAIDKFPSVALDLEEASKCFALNRYTAVVFHLMRVMEIGLRVLGNTLKDPRINPKTNPTWQRILQRCHDEQDKPLAQRSSEWQADELFFSGVSARLMAVKDAWRNPTMHIEITYTEETALDVLNHVAAFMRHLATKLHE